MGTGFLSQSMAGGFQPKGKTNLGFDSRFGGPDNNANNNKTLGESGVNIGDMLDTSAHQNNLLSTPSSKNDDGELLNGSDQDWFGGIGDTSSGLFIPDQCFTTKTKWKAARLVCC